MTPTNKKALEGAFVLLTRMALGGTALAEAERRIHKWALVIPGFNVREVAYVTGVMMSIYRYAKVSVDPKGYLTSRPVFDKAYKAMYAAERKSSARRVKEGIGESLRANRNRQVPIILYMCSKHQNPRPTHKNLQGRLYIDRMWRRALEKAGREDEIAVLEPLVKGLMTVQEVRKGPHWLMTAPNCKHRLIPIPYSELLKEGDAKKVSDSHSKDSKGEKRAGKSAHYWYLMRENYRREVASAVMRA